MRNTPTIIYLYKYMDTHRLCYFNINVNVCFQVLHADIYFSYTSGTWFRNLDSAENLVLNYLVLIVLLFNRYWWVIFSSGYFLTHILWCEG